MQHISTHPFISSTFSHKNIVRISNHNLQTLKWEEEEWPNDFYDTLIFANQVHSNPQPYQKRNIAFNLLKQASQDTSNNLYTVINDISWEDLELLCGKKNKDIYLGSIINKTHTQLGFITFLSFLVQPTTDINIITQRKSVIQELYKNTQLYKHLIVLFNELCIHENTTLSFWRPSDVFRSVSKRLYFQHPWFTHLNKFSLILEFRNRFIQGSRYFSFVANCLAAIVLPLYGISKLIDIPLPNILTTLGKNLKNTNKEALLNLIENKLNNKIYNHTMLTVTGIYTAFALKESYEWERNLIVLEQCMQTKLIHVASYIKTAFEIYEKIKNNTILLENLPVLKNLNLLLKDMPKTDQVVQEFFELLHNKTFEQTTSLFSRQGNIVRAYELMYIMKKKLIPLFEALGQLDAFLSVASIMRKHTDENATFSFVEFISSESPYIYLEDFWHPVIPRNKAVTNTITLGGPKHRQNIIVTGPNAGGKSTILKGIAVNLILAQSFGIVAARKGIITPFTKILTYLNIVDDLGSGSSLFKAEVLRAYNIITTVEKLKNSPKLETPQFAFVIADELFNSTTPKEGEAGSYSIAHHLGTFDNCITVIATHFELLTQLEHSTNMFQNYRVVIQERDDDTFTYLYKLESGISDQHIAFKILASEGFSSTIIQTANAMLNKNKATHATS